jgi:hypothetical protein
MSEVRTLVNIPEGSFPVHVVEVCTYIDTDGGSYFMVRSAGNAPLSNTLGILDLVKDELKLRAKNG